MIEGIGDKIKCVAQFAKDMDGFSASTGTGYQRHATGVPHDVVGSCHIFFSREEMQEIADMLGVGLQSYEHGKYEDWVYFIYDGVDFGSLVPKEGIKNE